MADFEYTLTKLSVAVSNSGGNPPTTPHTKLTAVVSFTKGGETYEVTMADIPHDQIRQVLSRFPYSVSQDQAVAELAGGGTFTVELIK